MPLYPQYSWHVKESGCALLRAIKKPAKPYDLRVS